jgi:glycosyltransferase involved in cell wall biosynthesis
MEMVKAIISAKPLVSIVVTSYNHAEYLDERMQSLLSQTYDNIEINVVDDCSTDKSPEVLALYQSNPKVHITYLSENGGYAKACNIGVGLSRGDYIMFAECDDFDDPLHVEVLMNKLVNYESIGIAYCRSNMVDGKGMVFGDDFQSREKRFRKACAKDVLIPQREMQKYFLKSCVIPNMSAAIIRKECLKRIGSFDSKYKACADWDFWCRLSRHCDFFYVAKPLNNFRTHLSTVRNMMAISASVMEIYDILFREYHDMELSFREIFEFKIAMGSVWSQYITQSPKNWLKNIVDIGVKSARYDKFMFFYMCLSLVQKTFVYTEQLFCKKADRNNQVELPAT